MKFSVSTSRYSGSFTKRATVYTNDANHQKETLVCTGQVRVPFRMDPARLTFGQITPDSPPQSKTIKITRGDGGPIAPELLPVSSQNVEATLREITPGEEYELKVDLVPPWPARILSTNLTLKTGVSQAPQDQIRVYARIMPRLSAERSQFRLPRDNSSEIDLRTRLQWSGGSPGKVLGATVSDPKLSVRIEEEQNRQYVVLHVPADYEAPVGQSVSVVVTTDDAKSPTLNIPVYPAPRAPRVRATPSRFTIPLSFSSDLDLRSRLVWTGAAPSKILDVSSSDPKLTVRVEEMDNEQAVVLHVPAGYTPDAMGRPMVTVKTDDEKSPTVRIPIYVPRPAARVRALPSRFTIPSKPDEEQEFMARLKWADDKPGKVLAVTTTDPQLSATLKDEGTKQYIVLHVPAGYEPPTSPPPAVTIKTDDPITPLLSIRVYLSRVSHATNLPVVPSNVRAENARATSGDKPTPEP